MKEAVWKIVCHQYYCCFTMFLPVHDHGTRFTSTTDHEITFNFHRVTWHDHLVVAHGMHSLFATLFHDSFYNNLYRRIFP